MDRGCGRFEWAVLGWNAPAIAFYQSSGAVLLRDWRIVRLTGPALAGLATAAPKTDAKAIKARILVCIGGDDPFIPLEQRADFEKEMRDAGVDWQMNLYGNTVHSFTYPNAANAKRPDAVRYSAEADRRSWKSMQDLFAEAFA